MWSSGLVRPGEVSIPFVHGLFSRKDLTLFLSFPTLLGRTFRFFKFSTFFYHTSCLDVTAVDYPEEVRRFQLNYVFISTWFNYRFGVRSAITLNEGLPSMEGLFSSSRWLEREVWDMFGIFFVGNGDLRRILTDYGFRGHPLRKDFPLIGFFECRYDEEKKYVVSEVLNMTQGYRNYDFRNPW